MSYETEFEVQESGYNSHIPTGDKEVWFQVVHGAEAGNRIKFSYMDSDKQVQEVMDSVSEGDVVTARLVDDLEGWKVVDIEKVNS